jgi:hypothetical protein
MWEKADKPTERREDYEITFWRDKGILQRMKTLWQQGETCFL